MDDKKGFFDRLESKQFTVNLITLLTIPLLIVVLIALIVVGWNNKEDLLNKIWNLGYLIIGLIFGAVGTKKVMPND